jgi:hypothetical protein
MGRLLALAIVIAPACRRGRRLALALRHVSAHAPSPRFKRERTIRAIAKQTPAYPSFKLFAAILGKRHDVGATALRLS